jgi:O-antigen ligase
MPPILAVILSLLFTVGLCWYDRRRNPAPSLGLWVPTLWLAILGSRPLTMWLTLADHGMNAEQDITEGSPVDRAFFLALMVLGVVILVRRKVDWIDFFRRNIWWTIFFAYAGISFVWSDFPDIALKRWIKSLGDVIMALVILSDARPWKALETMFKRVAFLLLPMSVVFIKYFRDLGRGYDLWTGEQFFTGVTTNKNMLGYLLFAFGLFFVSTLLSSIGRSRERPKHDIYIALGFLGMTAWLFNMADSKTPLLCLMVSVLIFVASSIRFARKYWATLVTIAIGSFAFLQFAFNISEALVQSAGRDLTLTGRTDLWASVLQIPLNPLVGAGFASFWLGDRLLQLWDLYFFRPTQAHNGYLEIYLNLGILGVICLAGVLYSSYRCTRTRWRLYAGSSPSDTLTRDWARYGMAYLVGMVLYNITEAAFMALHPLYVVMLMVLIDFKLAEPVGDTGELVPAAAVPVATSWWTATSPLTPASHASGSQSPAAFARKPQRGRAPA